MTSGDSPDKFIFLREYAKETSMKQYNIQYMLDSHRDYSNDDSTDILAKEQLAYIIHKNYDKMDESELQMFALKCLSANKIRTIVLDFELKYFRYIPKVVSLDDFQMFAKNVFRRYQSKAGGFLLEDVDWIIHRHGSAKHCIDENEILFENTLDNCDNDDDETDRYLNNLVEILQSYTSNIEIELRQKCCDGGKTVSILIWGTHFAKR